MNPRAVIVASTREQGLFCIQKYRYNHMYQCAIVTCTEDVLRLHLNLDDDIKIIVWYDRVIDDVQRLMAKMVMMMRSRPRQVYFWDGLSGADRTNVIKRLLELRAAFA